MSEISIKKPSPLKGRVIPWYGKLNVVDNQEAAAIWRTRDIEPEPCEPFGWSHDLVSDVGRQDDIEFGAKAWALVEKLGGRQTKVLVYLYRHDMTPEEVAQLFGVSKTRVFQIRNLALRRLTHPERIGTLMNGSEFRFAA